MASHARDAAAHTGEILRAAILRARSAGAATSTSVTSATSKLHVAPIRAGGPAFALLALVAAAWVLVPVARAVAAWY